MDAYLRWFIKKIIILFCLMGVIFKLLLIFIKIIEQSYNLVTSQLDVPIISIVATVSLGLIVVLPNVIDLKTIFIIPTKENYIKYCKTCKEFDEVSKYNNNEEKDNEK